VPHATGWNAFRDTLLDEGGDVWLWEVLGETENFFPDITPTERVALAERFIREVCAAGLAFIADGQTGRHLAAEESEKVVASGRWRTFPPAPERDERLVPTPKWEERAAAAREP
jgi:hypothetical protein